MRAARLRYGLLLNVWLAVPSFFGTQPKGTSYDLSHDAERCSYFVSHSWRDDGRRKISMLREFLFMQNFLGRALVV
jgi:hypothetical protein